MPDVRETDLYHPIKTLLEGQGYTVKGEVSSCDVVGVRGADELVIVELKTAFTLPLVFQGIRRQSLAECVYLAFAVPAAQSKSALWRRHHRDILKLCRLLGLGLITVRPDAATEIHLDPAPYRPRRNKRGRAMLLGEFQRRVGDPNRGGTSKRPLVTAYRQDALRCARYIRETGPSKAALVKSGAAVERAPSILLRDVYGWFHRVERGVYALTPNGMRALDDYADIVGTLADIPRATGARPGVTDDAAAPQERFETP